jgi:large subunit ribosomal protein L30
MAKIKITLIKGLAGRRKTHRVIVHTLGLGKVNSSVVQEDTPSILGMVAKVSHLVSVTPVEEVRG